MTNSPTPSPVTIAPKPCPFCGLALDYLSERDLHMHPFTDCVMSHYVLFNENRQVWNRRPSAGEDVKASPVVPVLELKSLEATMRAEGDYCNDEPWRQKMYREFADLIAQLIKEAKGG